MSNTSFPRVIVISGTPGVGKSSITSELQKMNYRTYNLNELITRNGLYYGFDFTRDSVIIDVEIFQQHLKNLTSIKEKYVIFDGHTLGLIPNEIVDLIFVIHCDSGELRKRLASRGYPEKKIMENLQAEIMEEIKFIAQEKFSGKPIYEFDSTFSSSIEIAQKIDSIIKSLF